MRRAGAALLAALLAAGCGDGGDPPPAPVPTATAPEPVPEPAGTGDFVDTGSGGLGAAIDLMGADPVADLVTAALRGDAGGTVAVASIVNEGARPVRAPRFVAELAGGGAVPVGPARAALDGGTPQARRALARLGTPKRSVAPGGAATLYLVLPAGVDPGAVARMRMVVPLRPPVMLVARRR